MQANLSPAEKLLPRLQNVRRSKGGWRTDCPNPIHEHGHGSKGKGSLSITEKDGILLMHCFACGESANILASVGLELADLYPERIKDPSPECRKAAREAMKRNSWAAALRVLSLEALVVLLSCRDTLDGKALNAQDYERLLLACERIEDARAVLR